MKYSENALKIYKSLYFNPDETDPESVHRRVATCVANDDEQFKRFFDFMEDKTFRPNSPCLINARPPEEAAKLEAHDNNLAACFVLGLDDSMESIMEMWSTCSKVYAGGGGTGIPISHLRERGSNITTGGTASGPIEYLKVVQTISDTVKSGGKSRRAANLTSFRYDHPDILEYITCKKNNNFSAVNISVLADDWFMEKVINGKFDEIVPLISPKGKVKVGETTVGAIWNRMIDTAWETGDPGLLFYDEANRRNALPSMGEVVCSNPCGEVLLPPYSCCDLGSINLNNVIVKINGSYIIDYNTFKEAIKTATEFLDNVISKTSFPTPKFEQRMTTERPIGLGLMGFSDILFKMGIPYGSHDCIELFGEICKFLTKTAFEHSIELVANGKVEPIVIPAEDRSHFIERLKYFGVDDEHLEMFKKTGIRNSTVTSIAPTGSISITCDASYAFEPCFALIWSKKLVDRPDELYFVNKEFEVACANAGIELTPDLQKKIKANKGSCQGIDEIPKEIQKIFVTAHDVGWRKKIEVQGAGQRWITLAISSTCNLPSSATVEDVAESYKLAWQNKLKGITVYRDGCLDTQPVNFGANDDKKEEEFPILTPMKRPMKRDGSTIEINTPHGKLYLTGNSTKSGRLFEVFMRMGQQGHVTNILLDALGKVTSKALQYGVPIDAIVDTMRTCGGYSFFFKMDDDAERSQSAESVVDALAKIIDFHFNNNNNKTICTDEALHQCPQCKQYTLVMGAGCKGGSCNNCGFSACG